MNILVSPFANVTCGRNLSCWIVSLQTVKQILQKAYCDADAVSDELVDIILKPGLLVRDWA